MKLSSSFIGPISTRSILDAVDAARVVEIRPNNFEDGWGTLLIHGAQQAVEPGMVVADLGAGPSAKVARALQDAQPRARYLAIEPHYRIELPPGRESAISIVQGTLSRLADNSLDIVVFNPPVCPSGMLNRTHPAFYAFAGDGHRVVSEVAADAARCLRDGGRFMCVAPAFLNLRFRDFGRPEVWSWAAEEYTAFVRRAPVRDADGLASWLRSKSEREHTDSTSSVARLGKSHNGASTSSASEQGSPRMPDVRASAGAFLLQALCFSFWGGQNGD